MLSHRARRILFALVSEYIATGEPVSSLTLSGTQGLDLSSASIRATFAELEAHGYLHKLHASAGRLPTERGLRAFVDALLATAPLPAELRATIESRFKDVEPGIDAALRHSSKVLAEVTGAAAVAVGQATQDWVLEDLRFISIRPDQVLAVIVSSTGSVQNRVLRVDRPLTSAEIERSNNILRSLLEGRTLAQIRQMLAEQLDSERGRIDGTLRLALTLGGQALAESDNVADVFVEGQAQLIGRPEFSDIDRARTALRTLEDKARLVQMLDRTLAAPGVQVLIGSEDHATESGDLSVVAAQIGTGSIGVIGSTRMDYLHVLPAVRFTAELLERILRNEPRDPGTSSNG